MPQDLKLDSFDLTISGGDFVISEATKQHQELLLLTQSGEWRETPMAGIGINYWLQDDGNGANSAAAIKSGFESDGMTVSLIQSTTIEGKWTLITEAQYGNT